MSLSEIKANKAVVQRYVDEIQNGHSIEAIEKVFAENFIDHTASGGGLFRGGLEGLKKGYAAFLQAFPDLTPIIHRTVAH